ARADAERSRTEADAARTETERLRERAASLAAEAGDLREQVRQLTRALRDAEEQQRRTAQLLSTEKGRLAQAGTQHDAELRRWKAKLAEAERELESARHAGREGRAVDDVRLWLLLETIGQAAHGLRRELALEPAERLPADFVADVAADTGAEAAAQPRGLGADDPARLDQLLALPKPHLVIDGYNVTKSGYGELSLEQQRKRLVSGLGGLAAQTGAEVTVAFDGAERVVGLPPAPRGVRVLFSHKGETADELIRRLVRAEPAGRPVVVISSDKEVADGVRRHGAYPLGADALLRRLDRS
ncbi:MAG: NYN domain-containing protein, partial [Micromonosporaceae bacterium]